jgi:hypothetical protein
MARKPNKSADHFCRSIAWMVPLAGRSDHLWISWSFSFVPASFESLCKIHVAFPARCRSLPVGWSSPALPSLGELLKLPAGCGAGIVNIINHGRHEFIPASGKVDSHGQITWRRLTSRARRDGRLSLRIF